MKTNNLFQSTAKLIILALAGVMMSCSSNPSIERYFVDHENKEGFASFTVPADILKVKDAAQVDEDAVEALDKLNSLLVLRYEQSEMQPELFGEYLAELNACLNPERYEDIFTMSSGNMRMSLKIARSSSNEKKLNELVGFIIQDSSFVIARLTGEIEPDKLAKLARNIDLNAMMENEELKGLIES